jgi:hypothetical protein
MDYQAVINEENDVLDGPDQTCSPFMQFETQEDQHNNEKRIEIKTKIFFDIISSF